MGRRTSRCGRSTPVLAAAVSYDRAVGYFNARELAYAARGVAPFVAGGGTMRLIVGAELAEADVVAVTGQPLEDVLAAKLTTDPFGEGVGIVEQNYLQLMSYLAREGRLQIRVGVLLDANGHPLTYQQSRKYFHTKFGILTDTAGDKIAFVGSNNDTGPGWLGNHETFSVYQSWKYDGQLWADYGAPLEADSAELWEGSTVAWLAYPRIAGRTPPTTHHVRETGLHAPHPRPRPTARRRRHRRRGTLPGNAGASCVTPRRRTVARSWVWSPRPLSRCRTSSESYRAVSTLCYLLADEVGLGKTIEAGLILRELPLSERVTERAHPRARVRDGAVAGRAVGEARAARAPVRRQEVLGRGQDRRWCSRRARARGTRTRSCSRPHTWHAAATVASNCSRPDRGMSYWSMRHTTPAAAGRKRPRHRTRSCRCCRTCGRGGRGSLCTWHRLHRCR